MSIVEPVGSLGVAHVAWLARVTNVNAEIVQLIELETIWRFF